MNKLLESYVIQESEDIYKAHWMLHRNGRLLIVVNNGIFQGVVSWKEIKKTYENPNLSLSEICNRESFFIYEDEDIYDRATVIMAHHYLSVGDIPIVSRGGALKGMISREQVFWKEFYEKGKLPRMNYAYCIYNAACEAKALGYEAISVIEFGVAGGNGLVNCEFHSREIERLLGVRIDIYGFDSAEGLPEENEGYKDMIHLWPNGSYKMERSKLESRLTKAKLVIGQIQETTKSFFDVCSPTPIGVMLIDVDRYSSTIPILEMVKGDDKNYLPRVQMYFDDIFSEYESQGESMAIREFNRNNSEHFYISPEGTLPREIMGYRANIKTLHRYKHKKYNDYVPIMNGWEFPRDNLELKLRDNQFGY